MLKVKAALASHGNSEIKIISKIERPVALGIHFDSSGILMIENIDAILEVTDGVMVARGDLGVEIPTWYLP